MTELKEITSTNGIANGERKASRRLSPNVNLKDLQNPGKMVDPEVITIQRIYTHGTSPCFDESYPEFLAKRGVNAEQYRRTIQQINEYYEDAEDYGCREYSEGCVTFFTCNLFMACTRPNYLKDMKLVERWIGAENEQIYRPRGLEILNPVKNGSLFIEIKVHPKSAENTPSTTTTNTPHNSSTNNSTTNNSNNNNVTRDNTNTITSEPFMNGEKKTKKHKSTENLIESRDSEEGREKRAKNSPELKGSKSTVIVSNPLSEVSTSVNNNRSVNNVNVNNESTTSSSDS
jgi:hypothetical protein